MTVVLEDGADYAVAGPRASTVAVRDDDGSLFRVALDPPPPRYVVEGGAVAFDALVTTIDDGSQAGTFTAVEDLRRAMRYRSRLFLWRLGHMDGRVPLRVSRRGRIGVLPTTIPHGA